MRTIFATFCVWAVALCAMAQGYTVTGHIKGLADGDTIQLYEIGHGISKPFAETIVSHQQFQFTGTQADPRGVFLLVKDQYGSHPFILNNSQIRLEGSATCQTLDDGKRSYFFEVRTEGSPLTAEFEQKVAVRSMLDLKYQEMNERFKDNRDSLEKASDAFFQLVEQTYNKLYQENMDTWWGPFLMEYTMSYFTEQQKPLYEQMSDAAKDSYYGKMVHDELYPKDLTGEPVVPFTLSDGKTLRDVLHGNRYVIIDFWASWCKPCRNEIPNLKRLYAVYADKGLQIVSISIDKSEAAWQKACGEEQLPWLSYLDGQGIAVAYKVQFIPAMFLVDNEGRLISDKLRGEELAEKLAELFATSE